jgi:RHS repeat-associated protein
MNTLSRHAPDSATAADTARNRPSRTIASSHGLLICARVGAAAAALVVAAAGAFLNSSASAARRRLCNRRVCLRFGLFLAAMTSALAAAHTALADISATGSFATQIPIDLPRYYGIEPNLNLSYSSQSGNGWVGVGWALTGQSEIRRAGAGFGAPRWTNDDGFYLDGSQLIDCTNAAAGSSLAASPSCKYKEQSQHTDYATRIESYRRIAHDPANSGRNWYVWDKDGTKRTYAIRLANGFTPVPALGWHLERVQDTSGHAVDYSYAQSADVLGAGQESLESITYGATKVMFYTEARPDTIIAATGDALLVTRYRLKTIDVLVSGKRVRSYALRYAMHPGSNRSVLTQVQEYGRDATLDSTGTVSGGTALPAITLSYQGSTVTQGWTPKDEPVTSTPPGWDGSAPSHVFTGQTQEVERGFGPGYHVADFDGDGRSDGLLAMLRNPFNVNPPELRLTMQTADGRRTESTVTLPPHFRWNGQDPPQDGRHALVHTWAADVNGDGLTDVIVMSWENVDQNRPFATLQLELTTVISEGDGRFRLAGSFQPTSWQTDTLFVDARGPRCQPGDVNGDGLSDFVCTFQKFDGNQFLGTALGTGNGTFDLSPASLQIADDPLATGGTVTGTRLPYQTRATAVGDVNADGLADVQILDLRPSDIHVCPSTPPGSSTCPLGIDLLTAISNGDGSYHLDRTPTPWNSGHLDTPLYAADLNGDGKSDYFAFVGGTKTQGTKTLRTIDTAVSNINGGWTLNTQDVPAELADHDNELSFGDANGDGKTDILAAAPVAPGDGINCSSYGSKRPVVTRILSKGDGTFALPARWDNCAVSEEVQQPWTSMTAITELQAADTNGDGLSDLLIAFATPKGSDKVDFGMYDSVSRATGADTQRWIPADVTGDGRDDFIYITSQRNGAWIYSLVRREDGGYEQKRTTTPVWMNPAARTWKSLDVNGDGRADLVHTQCYQPFIWPLCLYQLDTFLSKGDGTFTATPRAVVSWVGGGSNTPSWRPMDVNGDGRTDLVAMWFMGNTFSFPPTGGVFVQTVLSNGDGTWSQQPLRGPFSPKLSPFELFPGLRLQDTQSWRAMDVDGDGRADLVRVGSTKGATQVTTLLATGDANWTPKTYWNLNGMAAGWDDMPAVSDAVNWRVADTNGDGKADLVHVGRTANGVRVHTLLSQGNGDWITRWDDPTFAAPVDFTVLGEAERWSPTDANGDGRSDLVHVTNPGLALRVDTLLSNGDGKWTAKKGTMIDPAIAGEQKQPTWVAGDADGDGARDLVRIDVTTQTGPSTPRRLHVAALRSRAPFDLLTGYVNGLGGSTTVEYGSSALFSPSDPAHNCGLPLGATMQVVASTTSRDGRGGRVDKASYAYGCPIWSRAQRTFLGWQDVIASRAANPTRAESRTITRYRETDQSLTQVQDVHYRTPAGTFTASRDMYTYTPPGAAPPYKCLTDTQKHLDYGSPSIALNADTAYAYDEFGNVIDVFDYGSPAKTGDERTTISTYAKATTPYIVGLHSWQGVFEGAQPATTMRRSTYFCYDGANGNDFTSCAGTPTKGKLTAVQRLDDTGNYVSTTLSYDAFGNLAAQMSPRHFGSAVFYDQTYHLFPVASCNALSQCNDIDWDTTLGLVTKVKDANGAEISTSYDPLGRIEHIAYPNGGKVHRKYLDWGDPVHQRIRDSVADGTADGLWSERYLDGLGRIYRVVKEGDAPGKTFVRLIQYEDGSTRPSRVSDWFRPGSTQVAYETFRYDEAGRLIRQTHADGTSRTWNYGADNTSSWTRETDELQHLHEVVSDAYGRAVRVRDAGAGTTATTTYAYDAAGQLLTMTDPAGSVTRNTWDLLGNQTSVEDPDLGLRKATYDLNGNLKTQTDAKNKTTTYAHDALDRVTSKTYADGSKATFDYDEPGHGASKGQLTSVYDSSATGCAQGKSESYVYDGSGEISQRTKCIDGQSLTTAFVYDSLGRQKQLSYPDNEIVNFTYNSAGQLASVPGYVSSLKYDAAGHIRTAAYANGTNTTFRYGTKRPWLTSETVSKGSTRVYDATYTYGANGLLDSTKSTTNQMDLKYGYDGLDRLVNVTGDVTQSFQYGADGNLKFNSPLGNYTYPPAGPSSCSTNGTPRACPHPHGVETVGTLTMKYDANGQLSSVDDSATQKQQAIDWTLDHKPSVMSDFDGKTTYFGYDAWSSLAWRESGGERIRYFGGLFDQSSTRGLVKYYYAGPLLVARSEGGTKTFLHTDERGSPRAVTNAAGAVAGRADYEPYGKATTTASGDLRYVGSREAGLGLVYMNARFYDPRLGRFIAPDTIVPDPLNSQALNRYTYTYGNPVSYVDPSGHEPIEINSSYDDDPPPVSGIEFPQFRGLTAAFMPGPPTSIAPFGPQLSPFGTGGGLEGPTLDDFSEAVNDDDLSDLGADIGDVVDKAIPYFSGALYGWTQTLAPGGAFAPSPANDGWSDSDKKWFELGRGSAQLVGGGFELASGLGLAVEGAGIAVGTAPTIVGAVGGAAIAVTGVAIAAEATTDIAAGLTTLQKAAKMPSGGSSSGGQPRGGTYVLKDKTGKIVRIGRSNDLVRREAEHAKKFPDLKFEVIDRTDDYAQQRGLEQLIYDKYHYPGDLNRVRPISPFNPNRSKYLDAAKKFLFGGSQ